MYSQHKEKIIIFGFEINFSLKKCLIIFKTFPELESEPLLLHGPTLTHEAQTLILNSTAQIG